MRHRKSGRTLGRTSSHRKALFRNMVTSLLDHERIQTTDAKAKELRGLADRYRERPGGYTRIIKLGNRAGDAAPISIIELVDRVSARD